MSNYLNTQTGAYPVSQLEIRREFPNTSFPVPFAPPAPYVVVLASPQPEYNRITQGVRELAPQEVSGQYFQVWEVYGLTPEEIAANEAAHIKQVTDNIVQQTQQRLDDFAQTRNYDGILSLCTYATSTFPKFKVEGQYGVEARDATWETLYQILAEVEAGTRPMPNSYADIEPDLPPLVWPDEPPLA